MSNGELTNILVSTDVTRYLEFKQIAGSYVQQGSGPKATVAKVPDGPAEALRSPLMGIFEKRRAKKFLEWVGSYKKDDPSTHNGMLVRLKVYRHKLTYHQVWTSTKAP
jgi:Rab GDP dissociation inhibitor